MRTAEEKLTVATAVFVVIFFTCMTMLSKQVRNRTSTLVDDIIYEMPRPTKALQSIFDLSGREIVRIVKNLGLRKSGDKNAEKEKAAQALAAQNEANATKGGPAPTTKAVTAAELAKKAHGSETQTNGNSQDRSKLVTIVSDVLGAHPSANTSPDENSNNNIEEEAIGPLGAAERGAASPFLTEDPEKQKQEKQRSRETYWKNLLRQQPTVANMALLKEALSKEEISSKGYFEIVSELVSSNKPDAQFAGLYGLENTQSLASFTLVSQAYEKLDPANQKLAEEHLSSYAQSSRFPILVSALNSRTNSIVFRAGEVLAHAITLAKSQPEGDRAPSGRSSRTQGPPSAASSYGVFVPVLERLEKNPTYAEMAQRLLAELESLPKNGTTKFQSGDLLE